jgi:hypothetical protein
MIDVLNTINNMYQSYTVISSRSVEELVDWVNKKIIEGYIPVGGIMVVESKGYSSNFYYQSMIRKDLINEINYV